MDISLGSSQYLTILKGHFYAFYAFFKVKNVEYIFGLLQFQIFFEVLEILDFFFFWGGGVNGERLARAYI